MPVCHGCKRGKFSASNHFQAYVRLRAGRDVNAVHGDITARLNAGVLDRTEKRKIICPHDAVRVEFLLQATWRHSDSAGVGVDPWSPRSIALPIHARPLSNPFASIERSLAP